MPHFHSEGYAFFVTARLAGTIPKHIYFKIKTEYNEKLEYISGEKDKRKKSELYRDIQYEQFLKYEKILDSIKFGRNWLNNENVALVVSETLHYYDGKEYDLFSYTIMPNHIHFILKPYVTRNSRFAETDKKEKTGNKYFLTEILQKIKRYSAKEANKVLKRKGAFWQHESYDHIIRNKEELLKLTEYILNNPLKAGLCENANDWRWNYYNPEFYV